MKRLEDKFVLDREELADMVDFFEGIDKFYRDKIDMVGYEDYKKLFEKANQLLFKTTLENESKNP